MPVLFEDLEEFFFNYAQISELVYLYSDDDEVLLTDGYEYCYRLLVD